MSLPIYLDYNATAPILPAAKERMTAALEALPGNASSPHRFGQAARAALEADRARLAALLGFGRREVCFTSGGSEGNNLLLRWPGWSGEPAHVITSPIEHPSVLRACEWLASRGVALDVENGSGRTALQLAIGGARRTPILLIGGPERTGETAADALRELGAIEPAQ